MTETELGSVLFTDTTNQEKTDIAVNTQPDSVTEAIHLPNTEQGSAEQEKGKNTNSVSTREHKNCPFQNYAKDLESCKSAISSLQQENRELQEKQQLMDYAKLMKNENEKLLSTAESNQDENKTLKLETAVTPAKKYETEVNSLKAKLSDETSRSLILEEENKKTQT